MEILKNLLKHPPLLTLGIGIGMGIVISVGIRMALVDAIPAEDLEDIRQQAILENPEELKKIYDKVTFGGNPKSQFIIGNAYDIGREFPKNANLGRGFPQNAKLAASWYCEAAKQGYHKAQFYLGDAYEHGEGVQKDDSKAIYWYRKAAKQQYIEAQLYLGGIYEQNGNFNKARHWYLKAAGQEGLKAYLNLGQLYWRTSNKEIKRPEGNDLPPLQKPATTLFLSRPNNCADDLTDE